MKQTAAHAMPTRARSRGPSRRSAAGRPPTGQADIAAARREEPHSMASLESLCDRRDAAQAQPVAQEQDGGQRKGRRGG